MKKSLSVILVLLLLATTVIPQSLFSVFAKERIPIVSILGDSDPLYDKDGNKILEWTDLLSGDSEDDDDGGSIVESVANILYPFVVEGILTDKWDNYYINLQKEISELLGDAVLDKNGEATNGSGVSQESRELNEYQMTHDKGDNYRFYYDWRLDPWESAEQFKIFIDSVKSVTGAKQVAVRSYCLGTSVVSAYVSRYGTDGIKGFGFGAPVSNGAEILTDPICGRLNIDPDAIGRFLIDCNCFGLFSIPELVNTTVDMLAKSGVIDYIKDEFKDRIYYRIVEGATSALALSTFFTWPCYWASVAPEDYETAKNYVFGKEGSQKRAEYAGLIEKLDNYHENVASRIPEIMKIIDDNANLCVMAKYGPQMGPIIKDSGKIGDQLVSLERASFGATTSSIYTTLSDEYIEQRISEGKGKYISPDKQVDASTCMFPDYTWFVKGQSHSDKGEEDNIMKAVIVADEQLTVDDFDYTQFMVYSYATNDCSPMTEKNCNVYNWKADIKEDNPVTKREKLTAFINSALRWVSSIFSLLFKKFM